MVAVAFVVPKAYKHNDTMIEVLSGGPFDCKGVFLSEVRNIGHE